MTALPSLADVGELIDTYRAGAAGDTQAAKSCCAAVYGVDLVGVFLGESYHPGGIELTRRLAGLLDLRPGQLVLDVASGVGATAVVLAAEHDVDVVGIDLGAAQVAKATARAAAAGLGDRAVFRVGDAEQLPVDDYSFDAVVSECAFCTFPDKPQAAAEVARVARPGGRLGLTDVWLRPDRLDPELAGLAGRIACIADARPIDDTRLLLESAGFRIDHVERHDEALAATVEMVTSRLRAVRLLDLPLLRPFNIRRAIDVSRRVADVIDRGDAGYFVLTATKRPLP
ncbi:MAG: cyclopropane-fatty-acyl-phospholipid synthase family protein [Microbacteriaceae bacterium]